jgi:subtilase family serine protease
VVPVRRFDRKSLLRTGGTAALGLGLTVCAVAALAGGGGPGRSGRSALVSVGRAVVLPRRAVALAPLATAGAGRAPQADLRLDVVLRPRRADALARRGSSRGFISPAGFAARFGTPAATVASVEQALRARGLRVFGLSANRLVVRVSARPAVVERAFGTSLASYRLPDGRIGFANRSAPLLPAAVAKDVAAVVGLDSLGAFHRAALARASAGPQPSAACAQQVSAAAAGYPGSTLYTTSDIAHAYGFDALYGAGNLGRGTTVALIEFAPYLAGDVAAFQACLGSSTAVNAIPVDGGAGPPSADGQAVAGEVESELDIETVAGLAPASTIDVYEAPPSSTTAVLDAFAAAIANPDVDVISVSYGACEALLDPGFTTAEATLFQQAAAEGKTIVSAAGDSGSEDCYSETRGASRTALAVDNPASQPLVTGVGGTTLQSLGPPATEAVWNNEVGAGGGGVSSLEAMPGYQSAAASSLGVTGAYAACSSRPGTCREVPDVSANAGAPLAIYCTESGRDGCAAAGWTGLYGTSAGAPIWGALFALAIASPACGGQPIGFANPALYVLAGGADGAGAFSDVTEGNNDLGLHGGLYPAATGYDLATGLGTPVAGDGSAGGGGLVSGLCRTARALARPVAAGIEPGAGPLRGGTKVTITGSNLAGVTGVRFGAAAAKTFTLLSNTQLVAVAPAGRGTAKVSLATPSRSSAGTKAFRYLPAPRVRALTPSHGVHGGGSRVAVTGSGFVDVGGVRFGSRPARSFRVVSASRLVAVAPAGTGTVAVTVTTPGGTSARTRADSFRYTR